MSKEEFMTTLNIVAKRNENTENEVWDVKEAYSFMSVNAKEQLVFFNRVAISSHDVIYLMVDKFIVAIVFVEELSKLEGEVSK